MNQPSIPQCSPQASYRGTRVAIDAAIRRVLDGPAYILGSEVQQFEAEFAEYIGVKHAIAVANGTDALALALRSAGVTPGGLVATVSMTASATGAAIDMVGAIPLFVDIKENHLVLDVEKLGMSLAEDHERRIQAIVPVHLYGAMVDMSALLALARKYNVPVVEDAAQAHGAKCNGSRAGSLGFAGSFSFYPTKNLGAVGDGGCITTDSDEAAEYLRAARQYGWRSRYNSSFKGVNSRLDELQAAILRVKLPALDRDNEKRTAIATAYTNGLQRTQFKPQDLVTGTSPVWHQFVVRCRDRDTCRKFLQERGIGTLIHYPVPLHRQDAWREHRVGVGGLRMTEAACSEVVSLPIFPELEIEQVDQVINALQEMPG